MKHKMFSIWDEVIGAYSSPILAVNKGHMLRMIAEWEKNPEHPLTRNQKDKTLFEIGEWDDENGRVESLNANKNIGGLHEFTAEQQREI